MAAAEQKKSYQVIKSFRGLDTKANRTAIDENEFSWIENAQPIGYANIKIIPNYSSVLNSSNVAVTFTNNASYFTSANININDYVLSFQIDGSAEYYNIQTQTKGTLASAGTFSSSGISTAQWKNERILILDPQKGLYSWDAVNLISIGSVGVIALTSKGSGYTTAPLVTISAPNQTNGVQANAVTSLTSGANTVGFITLTNAGTGYTSTPTVTLTSTDGNGSGAAAVAGITTFATGTVTITVTDGGAGYTAAPVISISGGGGSNANATAIISGNTVTQVVMTNPGSGYTNIANLVVTATGTNTKPVVLQSTINNTPNISIATFSGRVWIAQGRTVFYSAAGSYSDFTSVSAGAVTLTDSTLHGNIQYLLTANDFLYIFGDDSINVFSNVQVQTNGTTLFTNTNVSASIGSKRPDAIFPYFRSVLFMNDYGVYALVGSTTSKISDPLDGVFPNIDFASPIYGGQVLLNNILCAAFNFRYYDAIFTQSYRYIQAVFFEKKWFITSQNDNLNYITSIPVGGKVSLYGLGNSKNLYQLYANITSNITSRIQTALLPMTDPIRTKQALKIGVEATASNVSAITLSTTVDNENRSSSAYTLSSVIAWQNNSLQTIGWKNNSGLLINWATVGYSLYKTDANQYGKYLGITVTSSNPAFVLNGFEFEHELRVRF
jgi:hypothetical protein